MAVNRAGLNRGGRQAGSVNKFNATIKDMIVTALRDVGGPKYLAEQAHANPVAFLTLVGKVLPLQLAGHDGGKLEVEFRWKDEPPHPVIDGGATSIDTDDDDTPTITFIGEC